MNLLLITLRGRDIRKGKWFYFPHRSCAYYYFVIFRTSLIEGNSYLVFHYTPSVLTARFNLSMVFFPLCEDPLSLRDDSQPECLFSPRRIAKVPTYLHTVLYIINRFKISRLLLFALLAKSNPDTRKCRFAITLTF